MLRVLFFLIVVLLIAFGATWMADHPGTVAITFGGREYLFSTLFGLVAVLVAAAVLLVVWTLIRFVLHIPSVMSAASASRRRQRGYAALSRGMVAVGSGDSEAARRYSADADRMLRGEPMALLLKAQAAQLAGDRDGAEQVFTAMLEHPDTRTLALRGLYMEAVRRDDKSAALQHAEAAQKIATLPWAATALLQARAAARDWRGALRIVDRNVGARVTDRLAGNRQRAVLLTGLALDAEATSPDEALEASREALKLAPTLVPAAAVAGRLLGRKSDLKRAARTLEAAYAATPHPDLANAYLHLRSGDSAGDRLLRAQTLAQSAPDASESRLLVAYAALDARDFSAARAAMQPLVGDAVSRPTRRACLMMADIEEVENGESGILFEWLQRASRGTPDPSWVADGTVFEQWAPISPISGRLDAYHWQVPQENAAVHYEDVRRLSARTQGRVGASVTPPADVDVTQDVNAL